MSSAGEGKLMIWQSISLMTVIEIVTLGTVGYAAAEFLKSRGRWSGRISERGFRAILCGLSLVALFYLTDLLLMHAFPIFMPRAEAMTIMREWHLNGSWLVTLLGIGTICFGFTSINRTTVALLDNIEARQRDVGRELAERKRAEDALCISEMRLSSILDIAAEAIISVDEAQTIVQFNQGAQNIFGYSDEEALGRPLDMLMPTRFRAAHRGHIERFEQSPEKSRTVMSGRGKVTGLRKDGTVFPAEASISLLELGGQNIFTAMIRDITERCEVEEQLGQSQKLEAVGQLTAGVAHDFNNMLAVIWGNTELLEDALGKDNPQLGTVLRATRRGADLTQRLLAFSRKQVLSPEIINVNNLITDIGGLLHRTLEEHIDIETAPTAGLWNCEVDPAQLENALVNLALNARDAMPDGGKLTIETANARLDDDYAAAQAEVRPGQYVMLAITDTGSGMPPEVRERVFEPFFTTKAVGAGSGLGLSMVYGFVKQSGGHVTIYSEEGEGTTVKLYLPRATETEAVERKPVTDEVPVARGETVLVVEDDPEVRTLVVTLLSGLGYQIMEAATGPAALEQLGSTTRVNLLLTDVVMPGGMNGRELAVEASRRAPGIQVLYMSGYTEDAILHHGRLDAGAKLLQKPFRRADLARAVREVLGGPSA